MFVRELTSCKSASHSPCDALEQIGVDEHGLASIIALQHSMSAKFSFLRIAELRLVCPGSRGNGSTGNGPALTEGEESVACTTRESAVVRHLMGLQGEPTKEILVAVRYLEPKRPVLKHVLDDEKAAQSRSRTSARSPASIRQLLQKLEQLSGLRVEMSALVDEDLT